MLLHLSMDLPALLGISPYHHGRLGLFRVYVFYATEVSV